MAEDNTLRCDVLVVGAGVAGLRAAIELAAAGLDVAVATKDEPQDSSSGHAKGGIAVVLSEEEPDLVLHEEDTLAAGAGLCDREAVSALVRDGGQEVRRLIEWGARFDREGDRYHLTREAAHSRARILHAGGDATGREIVRTLVSRLRGASGVRRLRGAMVTELLVSGEGCVGARVLDARGARFDVLAGSVLLATGGIGCCWEVTSNPPEATGDGVALALRAGCELGDIEFMQFHPTSLALPGAPHFLLTEALRGEGCVVRNAAGERFLVEDDPRAELAPRDVVARGIAREIDRQQGEPVYLDCTGLGAERLSRRFPGVIEVCRRYGCDPARDPIPVRPAAHYEMGGVVTDLEGRTSVPGLFAAGEVASTGVHGANRLASNSLLEGLVFGARAARAVALGPGRRPPRSAPPAEECAADPALQTQLRAAAGRQLGIVRSAAPLEHAVAWLAGLGEQIVHGPLEGTDPRAGCETANMIEVLLAVARAALWREESRGGHFREDHPRPDDERFRVHSRIDREGNVRSVLR